MDLPCFAGTLLLLTTGGTASLPLNIPKKPPWAVAANQM